jgi:aspartate aminotransferase/aminotransferase
MPSISGIAARSSQALSIKYNNLVYEMKQQGKEVTVLSLGEAFFDIPLWPITDLPFPDLYHYSHSRGIPQLRQCIARHYRERYGVLSDANQEILITAGSKAAIFLTLLSVLDPDDEVVIPEPAWVSYPEQVRLCYGQPVQMPWYTPVYEYEKFLTSRSRVIIINNPHNPTGKVYSEKELCYLVRLARDRNLYILADEAYSDFALREPFHSLAKFDETKQNVIVVNSLSKNLGMSGWRLGYVIGNANLINQILKANQHIVTCPATILEHYIARHFEEILALTGPQIARLDQKRQEVGRAMRKLGLSAMPGSSTFYFFVSIAPSRLRSEDFCMRLLKEEQVAAVPGIGYGETCDKYIRISFGTEPLSVVVSALGRIKALIDQTTEVQRTGHEAA